MCIDEKQRSSQVCMSLWHDGNLLCHILIRDLLVMLRLLFGLSYSKLCPSYATICVLGEATRTRVGTSLSWSGVISHTFSSSGVRSHHSYDPSTIRIGLVENRIPQVVCLDKHPKPRQLFKDCWQTPVYSRIGGLMVSKGVAGAL